MQWSYWVDNTFSVMNSTTWITNGEICMFGNLYFFAVSVLPWVFHCDLPYKIWSQKIQSNPKLSNNEMA